jgi:hypothetical protein
MMMSNIKVFAGVPIQLATGGLGLPPQSSGDALYPERMSRRNVMENSAYMPSKSAPRPTAPRRPASASAPSVYRPTKGDPAPRAPKKS